MITYISKELAVLIQNAGFLVRERRDVLTDDLAYLAHLAMTLGRFQVSAPERLLPFVPRQHLLQGAQHERLLSFLTLIDIAYLGQVAEVVLVEREGTVVPQRQEGRELL